MNKKLARSYLGRPFSKLKVLVAESVGFSPAAEQLLRSFADVQPRDLKRKSLLKEVENADILWVRLRNQIDAEILSVAKRLKAVVTATTGLNHIDLVETKKRGIEVLSLRGECDFLRTVHATAEHAILLALALIRRFPQAQAHVSQGGWDRDLFWGNELQGKTLGIVGYGRLGRIVGSFGQAFGMRVFVTDKHIIESEVPSEIKIVSLARLLSGSDLVSLHVSLSEDNRGFFGKREFEAMKRGAWFINTSRGELVDEEAMLCVLKSGHLSGAALDVISDECSEGMANNPLVRYAKANPNLIITPHIGGCTVESLAKTEVFMAQKLKHWCSRLR